MFAPTRPAGRPIWPAFDRRRGGRRGTSVRKSYCKRTVVIIRGHGDAGLLQQVLDLLLDPSAGIGSDGAQRLPFGFGEVDGEKPAGVLAHERESNATSSRTKTELMNGLHQFLE